MMRWLCVLAVLPVLLLSPVVRAADDKDARDKDARMEWWREARFGLFIHWGLYSTLEGEWKGQTGHAEWIRTTAQIPVGEYDKLVDNFNPVKFDADAWCQMAQDAGMKYVVITSKHHDGFCLFDSKQTDFDVMSTPFHRDIMKEMAEAARRHGLKICWYHSIMDWHHPDYLPRRAWEVADRPVDGADFLGGYVPYLRSEVRELLTNYGPIGVMWFDGEWENTWTQELGNSLYDLCREIQPDVIVNNRVSKGRDGMAGMTQDETYEGDFGTPEQEIPATGLAGVDWESCLTMNDHWGWNKADHHWKSNTQLIQMLCDIASKGGNFLLNVGPEPDGTFPPEAVERLAAIGKWMDVNGESIYGTKASPFEGLDWGRCTMKREGSKTVLYFHVFETGSKGPFRVAGLGSPVESATLLGGGGDVTVDRFSTGIALTLPDLPADGVVPVVAVEVKGDPVIYTKPVLSSDADAFIGSAEVHCEPAPDGAVIRYTTDGSGPGPESPVLPETMRVEKSCLITARCFKDGKPVSDRSVIVLRRVEPTEGRRGAVEKLPLGLRRERYSGAFDRLPEFDNRKADSEDRVSVIEPKPFVENEAWRITGWLLVDKTGVYRFQLRSDDGSRFAIDDEVLIANDGLHSSVEMEGVTALGAGWHPIEVDWFNRTGDAALRLKMGMANGETAEIPADHFRQRK